MNYIKENPNYLKRFHYTNCADELVYSTVLYPVRNQLNIDVTNSLRYIEWHDGFTTLTHPKILSESDYLDILKSGALFCRKIEMDKSKELLLLLDERISTMGKITELQQHPKRP